jgi:hypothetical protein
VKASKTEGLVGVAMHVLFGFLDVSSCSDYRPASA